MILVPLSSEETGQLEQDYTLLHHQDSQFQTTEKIMKTSFSLRIDKDQELN